MIQVIVNYLYISKPRTGVELTYFCELQLFSLSPGGGHSTFFQVGVYGPDFRSVGLANLHLPLKRGACERKISKFGGLRAENFQIWGLVCWKFPNLGACELKFGWKLRLLRLKFPDFLKRGSCELTLLLEMGPLRAAGEAWKGGLQCRTSPYPLSRSVPPGSEFMEKKKKKRETVSGCKCHNYYNTWKVSKYWKNHGLKKETLICYWYNQGFRPTPTSL